MFIFCYLFSRQIQAMHPISFGFPERRCIASIKNGHDLVFWKWSYVPQPGEGCSSGESSRWYLTSIAALATAQLEGEMEAW